MKTHPNMTVGGRSKFRLRWALLLGLPLICTGAGAQIEELFSRQIQIFAPKGHLAGVLVKTVPPTGAGWKAVQDQQDGIRLMVPADAVVDATRAESRALQVTLSDKPSRPRPILRIDIYPAEAGQPEVVDTQYAVRYAEEYPARAFDGKFKVTESGHLVLNKKLHFAGVGGSYPRGAATAYRIQWAYLDKNRQVFVTFDCPEEDWPLYEAPLARILLSLDFSPARRER